MMSRTSRLAVAEHPGTGRASVGILEQEPQLDESKDVRGNVEDGMAEMRDALARFNEVSLAMADPDADFDALLDRFFADAGIRAGDVAAACFSVAGPVEGGVCMMTNLDWRIDESALSASTSARRSGSSARAVFTCKRLSRVVQRCTPLIVQSLNPATPSAQPSHTPLLRIRHA